MRTASCSLLVLFAAGTAAGLAAESSTSTFTLTAPGDFILGGGAGVQAAPLNSLRSGNPGQHSTAAIAVPLTPGATISRVKFEYRYNSGFSEAGANIGTNFTVRVAGQPVYVSPHMRDYNYDQNRSNYSQPVPVDAASLSIAIPPAATAAEASRIELDFDNNDRNVQLLLPLVITVECGGGAYGCADYPLLPTFIGDHMALQRAPEKAQLWGHNAVPGETVTAALDGEAAAATATAGADGSWQLRLAPQPAGTGRTLTLAWSRSGRSRVLHDVAFGDVYFCSGQSNMEFSVNNAFNASAEIADSGRFPGIRLATAARAVADTPQPDVGDKTGGAGAYANSSWAVSSPAAFQPVGGVGFSYFSAACYFFGRDLYKALGGAVPIGLVASDWGGQPIEVFSSADALADKTCGGTVPVPAPAPAAAAPVAAGRGGPGPGPRPAGAQLGVGTSQLWNAMISPFRKMRFAGAVWYQGEANAGSPHHYSCAFPAMIADWRAKFELPEMSFFFVQLAAYFSDYASIRNAQMAALKLPRTGYAVAIDLGDAHSPVNPIHSRRKQEVGRRLALAAQAVQYSALGVVPTGPVFATASAGAAPGGELAVAFAPGTAQGLHAAPTADCDQVGSKLCCGESPFQVLLGDGRTWARAAYTFKGEGVAIAVPANASVPVAARYAWEAWPQCSLYNGVGGPENHTGIAATPWCWDGKAPCAY
eukprot:g500.t1